MSYYCNNCGSTTSHGYETTYAVPDLTAGMSKICTYLCDTRFETFSSCSTWTVTGLTTLRTGATGIESPPITHQNSSKWCMVLTKQSKGLYLSFLLKTYEKNTGLSVMLKADEIISSGDKRGVFPSVWCSLSRGGTSEQKLIRKLDASKNEDSIVLQCEIGILCGVHNKLKMEKAPEPEIGAVKALGKMFDEEILTDFNLHVDSTVMKAHRALLSAQSPYFAALLQPHTKEAQEGRVEVSDVKPDVMKQVLLYMYKGAAPALKDMPWEILIAADKYQLLRLKGQCEAHLAGCLNVDNAAETAANARVFSCGVLWDRAVYYIKQNLCEVMSTSGWRDIITTHPEAVQSISELMA